MASSPTHDLAELATTEDAGRALGEHGDAWDAAIQMGIDVSLLERNLRLTPVERIRCADEHMWLRASIQARTVAEPVRAALERGRLAEKLAALEAMTR